MIITRHTITPVAPPLKVGKNQAMFDKLAPLVKVRVIPEEDGRARWAEDVAKLKAKRNKEMVTMYNAGRTTKNLSDLHEISGQQVRKILKEAGVVLVDRRRRQMDIEDV